MHDLDGPHELQDPAERAKRAGELVANHQATVAELSRSAARRSDELVSAGRTHAQIAEVLGMTRARVSQLMSSGPRPERAFLGSGPVTVAIGGKREVPRKLPVPPISLISAETFAAFEMLASLARNETRTLGIARRARPGSHPTTPTLAVFAARTAAGTFSTSPACTPWVPSAQVRYVEQNLEQLYREIKIRRFSTLVECRYDPGTLAIISVTPVTPIHRHETV